MAGVWCRLPATATAQNENRLGHDLVTPSFLDLALARH
jgi:hypothetical protein